MENAFDVNEREITEVEDLKRQIDLLECKNWGNEGVLRLADLAPRGGRKWGQQMMLQVVSYRTGEWITFAPDNDWIRSLPVWYKFARDELGWTDSIVLCVYSPDE